MTLITRTLPQLCGRLFVLTLLVDLVLLTAVIGAPWVTWLWPGAVAALAAIGLVVQRLAVATRTASHAPPWSWLLPAVLLPVSTLAALDRGLWAGSHAQARLRFRAGATALLLALASLSAGRHADTYAEAAGLATLDTKAAAYLDTTLEKATVMLLTVATLNGAISVLKSFDISVGVGLSLGEVLDPIDDLVETLSWVMAASTASLVAQRLLLEIGTALALPTLLAVGLLLLALPLWLPAVGLSGALARLGQRLIWAAVLIRLVVPVIAVISDHLSARFIEPGLAEPRTSVESVTAELAHGSETLGAVGESLPATSGSGLWAALREAPANLTGLLGRLNVSAEIQTAKKKVLALAGHLVRLIALLLLQTILLPFAVAWAFWRMLALLGGKPVSPIPAER